MNTMGKQFPLNLRPFFYLLKSVIRQFGGVTTRSSVSNIWKHAILKKRNAHSQFAKKIRIEKLTFSQNRIRIQYNLIQFHYPTKQKHFIYLWLPSNCNKRTSNSRLVEVPVFAQRCAGKRPLTNHHQHQHQQQQQEGNQHSFFSNITSLNSYWMHSKKPTVLGGWANTVVLCFWRNI